MKWPFSFVKKPDYEAQKLIAQEGNVKQRIGLAKSTKTNKEILFYLAQHDPNEMVRRQVAHNMMTPLHANMTLAVDENEDVRLALSGRLVQLLPELSIDKQSQLYAYAVQALGTLALDEVLKIRKSLAVTLKDIAAAPPSVAAQLARDIEREVAEPILRFCVALEDNVLIDIISTHPKDWAAQAVAKRSSVSAKLSKAIIGTNNNKAGQYLIENKGADMNEDVLHEIIIRAKDFPEWHKPLVLNHALPENKARQLARYADTRIRKLLQDRGGYDLTDSEIVTDATRRRIHLEAEIKNRTPNDLKKEIKLLAIKNALTEDLISDHLALRDEDFVYATLAYQVGSKMTEMKRVFKLKKAEAICALCWKAGYSMRLAFRLQQDMAGISHKELIVPRGGTDYPLSEDDMRWHLEFLDITG